ncbi:hypothetical protein Ga0074812_14831 [Parafrankia irregularis]|uniref:Uncharacterized protein n=1 Tax=Parafrankia irregularis TaxID=795642 RepID=A0A0S4R099_9ACTN|nr:MULTISPECIES: hypothetical protein [Parafrankia]MBE3206757.1 hypothetical protein [Parafrankia sp. CH37]CUU60831.1 hypothetical protein Ga0074812_14831 [Parafrankia irregularis]
MTPTPTTPHTELLAATTQASAISGGVTGGVVTMLALIGFGWLVFVLIKKDKLKVAHVFAVVLAAFVFQLTPIGQLAYGQAMALLSGFSTVAA